MAFNGDTQIVLFFCRERFQFIFHPLVFEELSKQRFGVKIEIMYVCMYVLFVILLHIIVGTQILSHLGHIDYL